MKSRIGKYAHTGELREAWVVQRDAIHRRLSEFAAVPASEYFYELVYCLLTPQSSAANAERVVEALRAKDFHSSDVHPAAFLRQPSSYIRFHNTKGEHLLRAKESFPLIHRTLCNGSSGPELRAWLVGNVRGLGWKEAGHLLRNIGHRDLAILDRHILRNLKRHGVIRSIPASLTPKRYLAIEERFGRFAHEIGIPMDALDLLFWSRETGEIRK